MENPIKQIKLNNLEYNPNRDPQVYRRSINKPFDLKVNMSGSGNVTVKLSVAGDILAEETVSLPGAFSAKPSFDTAGTRVGTISLTSGNTSFATHVRFDVLEYEYKG